MAMADKGGILVRLVMRLWLLGSPAVSQHAPLIIIEELPTPEHETATSGRPSVAVRRVVLGRSEKQATDSNKRLRVCQPCSRWPNDNDGTRGPGVLECSRAGIVDGKANNLLDSEQRAPGRMQARPTVSRIPIHA
ncbi:hypothetical protein B0T25DRAFT_516787 [Lasiosphaeria hispida]|uniref:Secreted protein n=1 Tax=Lasiosphaeria hispida TaxID=260671 RepID=A0AAJ0MG20_9PEZI|nr:hypothetical protein B0T25DRAFT_516787 [Lasiosphaeria hispida]